jgi:glycosyltransferase involved in cell wall biosynthesis
MRVTKPLVSAIVPTYNHADCVGHAVESIVAQDGGGENFQIEVIVVDDASTDRTPEVLRHYSQIKYLRQSQRHGVAAAMNAGIRASSGDYVSFLGADDEWLPQKLRVQLPLLAAHPEVAVVYSQVIVRTDGNEVLFPDASQAPSGRVFEAMLASSFAGHHAATLMRREAIDKTGDFDEGLATHEDYDLSLRLAFHFDFLFAPGPVTIYNLSPRGWWLSNAIKGDGIGDYRRVIEKALQMLPDEPRYRSIREEAPIQIALQRVTAFVLANDPATAWTRLLEVLREYPSSVRIGWVRNRINWIIRERLSVAPSPISAARELSAQITAAANENDIERVDAGRICAEIWAEVVLSRELRSRVRTLEVAYAAAKAVDCVRSDFDLLRRLGSRLLKMPRGTEH